MSGSLLNPFLTEYCESRAVPSVAKSQYLQHIGAELDPGIDIMWTGESGSQEGGRESGGREGGSQHVQLDKSLRQLQCKDVVVHVVRCIAIELFTQPVQYVQCFHALKKLHETYKVLCALCCVSACQPFSNCRILF